MGKFIDLTGQKFGRLTVIGQGARKRNRITWHCICECGKSVDVLSNSLLAGNTKSCGCYQRQRAAEAQWKHGEAVRSAPAARLYNIWTNMRVRCNCKTYRDYADYGGRGITGCQEWDESYDAFESGALANGYSDDKTLDRRNNDLSYTPENCRWATILQQENNRRSNRYITCDGVTHTIAEWARIFNINYYTLYSRLKKSGFSSPSAIQALIDERKGRNDES